MTHLEDQGGTVRRFPARQQEADRPIPVDAGDGDTHPPDMTDIDRRLHRLEGAYDALKVVRPMTLVILAILIAVIIGGFTFMGVQLVRIDGKIDAIPQRLTDEFRAMRAEMAAQTSAIANSITATKQVQPQILVLPAPSLQAPTTPPTPTPQPSHR